MTALPTHRNESEGRLWTCSYVYDGRTFVVHVVARTREEAEAHLAAIGATGQVDGELVHEGEVTAGAPGQWGTA